MLSITYIALLTVGLAVGQLPDFKAVERNMAILTSELVAANKVLNDATTGMSRSDKASNAFNYLMDFLIGKQCGDDQFQCGNSVQCVSYVSVCDGYSDCVNGLDEVDCVEPFAEGDIFDVQTDPKGQCLTENDEVKLRIFSVNKRDWFTQRAIVEYAVRIIRRNRRREGVQFVKGTGVYNYGTKQLTTGSGVSGTIDILAFAVDDGQRAFLMTSYFPASFTRCSKGLGRRV